MPHSYRSHEPLNVTYAWLQPVRCFGKIDSAIEAHFQYMHGTSMWWYMKDGIGYRVRAGEIQSREPGAGPCPLSYPAPPF